MQVHNPLFFTPGSGHILSQRVYKSMTVHADHMEWQDVHHGVTEDGAEVYIKITAYTDGRPPVIQS